MDLQRKAMMLVIFTALISGISIFINSFAVKGFDSSVFTFSKNILVAVLLFAIILGIGAWKEVRELKKKEWWSLAALGLIGGSIPFLLYFRGVQLANAATASFLHKMIFLPVVLLAILFLKEKINAWIVTGAGFILVGTYVLSSPKIAWNAGFIFIATAVLFWAGDNVLAKHLTKGMRGTIVAFGRMFFGSLFIAFFLAASGKLSLVVTMSGAQYLWIILTATLLLLYVFTFYNGLKQVKVTTATAILSLGLPVTTILGYALGGTALTFQSAAGILLIIVGAGFIALLSEIHHTAQGVAHHGRS